jgi:hypothetical protein
MNIARFAIAPALALSLAVGGFAVNAAAEAKGDDTVAGCACGVAEGPAVVITGGTVSNQTNLDLSANAGTAIGDASGGNFNVSTGDDISVAGQGGGANASANGGAIAVGDVNSGGNAGNAIVVGNTTNCLPCPEPEPEKKPEPVKPAPEKKPVEPAKPGKKDAPVVYEAPAAAPAPAPEAAPVVALPATGVGLVDAGLLSALAAASAAGAAGFGLRRRG